MYTCFTIAVGIFIGFCIGILSCTRPHRRDDEAVALKITEGKDEF